jgi:glutaredoxin
VTLYGRPGCHLCDEARAVLIRLRRTHGFVFSEVNIEDDDALHARYLERIPVIAVNGEERFDYEVDEQALAHEISSLGA